MTTKGDKSKINKIIVLYIELFLHNELSFIHSLNKRRNMGDIYFVDDSEYKNPETLALHGGNYRFDPVT